MSSSFSSILTSVRWLLFVVVICVHTSQSMGSKNYCGRKLGETLDLVCTYGFGKKLKKSIDPLDYYGDAEEETPFAFEEFPFLSKFQENSLAKTRQRRFGIADECCKKPCSIDELRTFCFKNGHRK